MSGTSNKPRIVFAHRGLTYGGVERWMLEFLQQAKKFEVKALALDGAYYEPKVGDEFWTSGVKIYSPHEMPEEEGRLFKTKTAKEALQQACQCADLLVVVAGFNDLRNNLWGLDLPIVLVSHGASSSMAKTVKDALPAIHYMATVCEAGLKTYPLTLRDQVAIIPNGINPQRAVSTQDPLDLTKLFEISNSQKVVCQIARQAKEKNPRAIIQALSALPEGWVGISVGSGPLIEQMIEEAKAYVPGRLFFAREDSNVADILAISDVCLLASDTECFPLVMLEAWFSKTPLVVTEFPTVKDLYSRFGTLFFRVPLRPTPTELSHAIQIAESVDYKVLDKIEEFARKNHDSSITVPIWEDYFEKVIEDWKRPTSDRHFELIQRTSEEEVSQLW